MKLMQHTGASESEIVFIRLRSRSTKFSNSDFRPKVSFFDRNPVEQVIF